MREEYYNDYQPTADEIRSRKKGINTKKEFRKKKQRKSKGT
jgi:hypothetical protein